MNKKIILFVIGILLLVNLTACQAQSSAASVASTETANSTATLTQLMYGTIGLENSDYAVDAEQAATLLPLWKAYNVLRSDSTVATEELQGLINQIKRSMTDEQIAYIEENNFDSTSISDLVATLGLETVALATGERSSEDGFQANAGGPGGGPGGNMPSGGAPMGGMGITGGEQMDTSSMSEDQLAQLQAQREAAGGGMGNNSMYIEMVITLLKQKIGS